MRSIDVMRHRRLSTIPMAAIGSAEARDVWLLLKVASRALPAALDRKIMAKYYGGKGSYFPLSPLHGYSLEELPPTVVNAPFRSDITADVTNKLW